MATAESDFEPEEDEEIDEEEEDLSEVRYYHRVVRLFCDSSTKEVVLVGKVLVVVV